MLGAELRVSDSRSVPFRALSYLFFALVFGCSRATQSIKFNIHSTFIAYLFTHIINIKWLTSRKKKQKKKSNPHTHVQSESENNT